LRAENCPTAAGRQARDALSTIRPKADTLGTGNRRQFHAYIALGQHRISLDEAEIDIGCGVGQSRVEKLRRSAAAELLKNSSVHPNSVLAATQADAAR